MILLKTVALSIHADDLYVGEVCQGGVFVTADPALARAYAVGETPPDGFRLARVTYRPET